MNSSTPTKTDLLTQITTWCDASFGPDAQRGLVLVLAALSGRTNTPVSARTVGDAPWHAAIATTILQLLGTKTAMYLTGASEAKLAELGPTDVRTIIYDGASDDVATRRTLSRLILGLPVHRLVNPSAEDPKDRVISFDRPVSIIAIGADDITEPRLAEALLTVRLNEHDKAMKFHARRRLARFAGTTATGHAEEDNSNLMTRLVTLRWDTPVIFEDPDDMIERVGCTGDATRVVAFLSLARVVALLRHKPVDDDVTIEARYEDLNFVVRLLEEAGVDDDRVRIGGKAAEFLRFLQLVVDRRMKAEKGHLQGKERDEESSKPIDVLFTRDDVWNLIRKRRTVCESTVYAYMRELVDAGMLDCFRGMPDSDGRPFAMLSAAPGELDPQISAQAHIFRLTGDGLSYKRALLADLLKDLTSAEKVQVDSGAFEQDQSTPDSPTSRDASADHENFQVVSGSLASNTTPDQTSNSRTQS
ncbi:MAG: hypothetical protein GC159_16360 [Phycisphaera sp.]|nr:hypothetical protein [Phycisphaera sp.]